jgi:PKHD-type hydroxylase
MAFITRQLNGQFFDFDLYGFVEDFQYTVYEEGNDHYTWHMDKGKNSTSPRKLSLVLQLSDPSEYDGGDLEIFTGVNTTTLEKKKGIIHAFPSFVMHRVTPVTRGVRRTLVIWVSGPKFK